MANLYFNIKLDVTIFFIYSLSLLQLYFLLFAFLFSPPPLFLISSPPALLFYFYFIQTRISLSSAACFKATKTHTHAITRYRIALYRPRTRSCFTRVYLMLERAPCESLRFKMIFLARELSPVRENPHFSHRVRCLTIGAKLNACRSYASHASILIECPFVELHHPIVKFPAKLKYFGAKKKECGFSENKNRRENFIYLT